MTMERPLDWALPRGVGPTVIPLISNWADYAPDLYEHIEEIVKDYWILFGLSADDHKVFYAPTWTYDDGTPVRRQCCFAHDYSQWIDRPSLFAHE